MVVIAWVILLCACVRYIWCDIAVRMRVSLAVRLVHAFGLLSRTVRGFCRLPLICIARDDCGAVAVVVVDWVRCFSVVVVGLVAVVDIRMRSVERCEGALGREG